MCGIVGLLIKNPAMREHLGALMTPMLISMTERGPDSAGVAVFGAMVNGGLRKYSLYVQHKIETQGFTSLEGNTAFDWEPLALALGRHGAQADLRIQGNHAVLVSDIAPATLRACLREEFPRLHLLSTGRAIDLYKDIGAPAAIAQRYDFSALRGSHVVAHTRMATESAVTPAHAHPFTAGEDFCLVHNGSLSNPYAIRRKLETQGIQFETDNDTEAACRYLEWRLREGDDLETALHSGIADLDGFYAFLMGTADKLALLRDAFGCKPAVVAETADYVAIASEFRALAHLPGVEGAHVYEPVPEEMYVWKI